MSRRGIHHSSQASRISKGTGKCQSILRSHRSCCRILALMIIGASQLKGSYKRATWDKMVLLVTLPCCGPSLTLKKKWSSSGFHFKLRVDTASLVSISIGSPLVIFKFSRMLLLFDAHFPSSMFTEAKMPISCAYWLAASFTESSPAKVSLTYVCFLKSWAACGNLLFVVSQLQQGTDYQKWSRFRTISYGL